MVNPKDYPFNYEVVFFDEAENITDTESCDNYNAAVHAVRYRYPDAHIEPEWNSETHEKCVWPSFVEFKEMEAADEDLYARRCAEIQRRRDAYEAARNEEEEMDLEYQQDKWEEEAAVNAQPGEDEDEDEEYECNGDGFLDDDEF